jgi:hypothetical protein
MGKVIIRCGNYILDFPAEGMLFALCWMLEYSGRISAIVILALAWLVYSSL